jgi:hypothetical protein
MSGSTFWNRARDGRLRPMGRFEIEDDEIRKVGSMFVFAAKYKQFVPLVECSSMAYLKSVIDRVEI